MKKAHLYWTIFILLTAVLSACAIMDELWTPSDVAKDLKPAGSTNTNNTSTNTNGGTPPYQPTVYVCGRYKNVSTYACYWIGGVRYTNDSFSTANSSALSIFVSGTSIVIGGYYTPASTINGFYWITNQFYPINTGTSVSRIYSVYYDQNKVYYAGISNNYAKFGTNSTFEDLAGNLSGTGLVSRANSIFVSPAGDVYIAGFTNNVPCYWKNNVLTSFPSLGGSGGATSIYSTNNITVIGGYTNAAILLTNGVSIDLSSYGAGSVINSVFISGNKIYAAGYTNSSYYACYWVIDSGTITQHDLSAGSVSQASSIYVYGTNVYVCGYTGITGNEKACYWLNDTLYDISGNTNSWASGIIVQ